MAERGDAEGIVQTIIVAPDKPKEIIRARQGEIIRALISLEQRYGRAVFDTIAHAMAHRSGLPELKDFWNPPETYFDTIITAEPTYAGVGHQIRYEITAKKGRKYTSEDEIQGYGLDRLILL